MSNSSFIGVSNEIYGRINSGNVSSANVSAGTVKTGSLSCERLDYPGDFPLTAITFLTGTGAGKDVTLTDANISIISNKGILFIVSGGLGAQGTIIVGADTSARAAQLITLFNISDAVPSRLIKVSLLTKNAGFSILIKNSSGGSSTYVQFNTFTANTVTLAGVSDTSTLVESASTMDGYILVSKGSPVLNSSTILFTVIGKASA